LEKSEFKREKDMRKLMMAVLFALAMFGATAIAQDTARIGWIDPLSGAVPALAKET
jgi:hypothetical protein